MSWRRYRNLQVSWTVSPTSPPLLVAALFVLFLPYSPEMPSSNYGQLLVGVDDYRNNEILMPEVIRYLDEQYPSAITWG